MWVRPLVERHWVFGWASKTCEQILLLKWYSDALKIHLSQNAIIPSQTQRINSAVDGRVCANRSSFLFYWITISLKLLQLKFVFNTSTDTLVLVLTSWFLLYALSLKVQGRSHLPLTLGQQKLATCFETLLQNELNTHVARFTTHESNLSCNKSGCYKLRGFWLLIR